MNDAVTRVADILLGSGRPKEVSQHVLKSSIVILDVSHVLLLIRYIVHRRREASSVRANVRNGTSGKVPRPVFGWSE